MHGEQGQLLSERMAGIGGLRAAIRELAAAEEAINLLPLSARVGVRAAADIFAELTNRLAATPAAELKTTRISVPNRTKAWLAARDPDAFAVWAARTRRWL